LTVEIVPRPIFVRAVEAVAVSSERLLAAARREVSVGWT
jgi:hypothetical protein